MNAENRTMLRLMLQSRAKLLKVGSLVDGWLDRLCICCRFTLFLVVNLAIISVAIAYGDDGRQESVLEEFDVPCGGDAIMVPVSVNGEPFRFIVDTGSSSSAIVERHRRLLGKATRRIRGNVRGGSIELEYFAAPRMMLGGIELSSVEDIACINLDDMEEDFGRIDGILGMDALKYMVLLIDFDVGKVRFLKSANGAAGRAVPLVWRRRKMLDGPFIAATIDGDLPCEFLIDSGCVSGTFGTLDLEPFDILVRCGAIEPLSGSYSSHAFSRSFRVAVGRIRTIEIDGLQHKNELFGREAYIPSLGIAFLCRYVATFDFPNSVVYLCPGKQCAQPDRLDKSGIYLRRQDDQVVVDKVRPGSSGELAGFERGDVLQRIERMPVRGSSLYRISRLFSVPGSHAVVVRRGRDEVALNLVSDDNEEPVAGARRQR